MSILATTFLSDNSRAALRAAARIAERRDLPLRVLYCDEGFDEDAAWRMFVQTPWEEPDVRRREAREQLDTFIDETLADTTDDLAIETDVALDQVEDAVASTCEERDIQLLVVGATGASDLATALIGNTAEELVRTSPVPVLVVPHDTDWSAVEEILAPVDLSDPSRESFGLALDLARQYGAHLHILRSIDVPTTSVVPYEADVPPIDMESYERESKQSLESFIDEFDTDGVDYSTSLPVDTPHSAIVRTAEERGSDLVIMGTHGRRGVRRLLLGSTTTRVLRQIPAPLLTVRPADQK